MESLSGSSTTPIYKEIWAKVLTHSQIYLCVYPNDLEGKEGRRHPHHHHLGPRHLEGRD